MGALEQITQLRSQGISDDNIMKNLQDSGFPPKEINDAFNQAQIKKAVSDEVPPSPEQGEGIPQNEVYVPTPQAIPEQQEMYYPQPQGDPSQYQEQEDYYSPGGFDTSTIIEISEQVFSEKIQTIQKQIEELIEFKTLAESKMENTLERIKKIEKIIDNLQISILQKIGSYGGNLESIKKEMSMMQDSFRKMVNPIARHAGIKSPEKKVVKKPVKIKTRKTARKK